MTNVGLNPSQHLWKSSALYPSLDALNNSFHGRRLLLYLQIMLINEQDISRISPLVEQFLKVSVFIAQNASVMEESYVHSWFEAIIIKGLVADIRRKGSNAIPERLFKSR
jgi:hypothetical protein